MTTQDHIQKDPKNLYYARGPRHRLSYEIIRDQDLASSGLLHDTIGGQSVFPYQPANMWEEKTSGRFLTTYIQSHGKDLHRRSLYTFFKRTAPPPNLMTFDASDRAYCSVKKNITNTPLQALTVMNDPQLLEAARVLAAKGLIKHLGSVDKQLEYIYLQTLGRIPNAKEQAQLKTYFAQELNRFKSKKKEAEGLLSVGEYGFDKSINPFELAALTVVVHTLMNTDEFVTKS